MPTYGGFVVALLLVLASFLTAQWAYIRHREILDILAETQAVPEPTNGWSKATDVLTVASTVAFTIGAAAMSAFVVLNLPS